MCLLRTVRAHSSSIFSSEDSEASNSYRAFFLPLPLPLPLPLSLPLPLTLPLPISVLCAPATAACLPEPEPLRLQILEPLPLPLPPTGGATVAGSTNFSIAPELTYT